MRVDYWSLPADLHAALTSRLGAAPTSVATQPGGFSGGVAARLTLADGRSVFVKGCPERHPIVAQYEVEAWFGRKASQSPGRFPAPPLWGEVEAGGWYVLVFEDVDGHDADLSNPVDLGACLALFDRLGTTTYPDNMRPRIPPVSVSLGHLAAGWRRIAEEPPAYLDPWARANLDVLRDLETGWTTAAADGERPVHTDLHPGNVLVRGVEALAVDWTRPSVGAAWVDPLLFCLRDPAVRDLPAWFGERHDLPEPALHAFLAGAAGHWTDAARLPAPSYAPGLRSYEAARAGKALAWLRRAREDVRS